MYISCSVDLSLAGQTLSDSLFGEQLSLDEVDAAGRAVK